MLVILITSLGNDLGNVSERDLGNVSERRDEIDILPSLVLLTSNTYGHIIIVTLIN